LSIQLDFRGIRNRTTSDNVIIIAKATPKEENFGRDYYPAVLFHQKDGAQLGFAPATYKPKIGFYAQQVVLLWKQVREDNISCYDFEMKLAQLLQLRIPGTLLLVDESQDMDACQIDWVAAQQVRYGTHVYMVGDPAQAIYEFRGAKPRYLMNLEHVRYDCPLTESWRFGWKLSHVANIMLFAKEYSPQTTAKSGCWKNWIPYRTRAGRPFPS